MDLRRTHYSEFVLIGSLYLTLTIAFLWFAVRPNQLHTHLQTRDSVFIAAVMDHVARCPFNQKLSFWDFGIFYPLNKTLCLSEHMITPAIFMAPIIWLTGYVTAFNAWIYFCWWSLSLIVYIYLRHRGLNKGPAFWGGLFISFSPDRAWHAAGHGHLYYHTGLFLALLAWERVLKGGGWKWRILFLIGFLSQMFAGIYIAVIASSWGIFAFSASAWETAKKRQISIFRLIQTCGKFLIFTILLGALLYVPILHGYIEFGKGRPQNSLEQIASGSATLTGYIIPPVSPDRLMTLLGKLIVNRIGAVEKGEDTQYIGIVGILLLLAGLPILVRNLFIQRHLGKSFFLLALAVAGITACILSLGPYYAKDATNSRLPFACIYAWIEPLRFFRAPSRFAFAVVWSVGILGAFTIQAIQRRLRAGGAAIAFSMGCILLTALDFLPINDLYRISCLKQDFTTWLNKQTNPPPFIELPVDSADYMAQLGWHHVPVANGYSGYAPENRLQELTLFESSFPGKEALIVMADWRIKNVFMRSPVSAEKLALVENLPGIETLWKGPQGVFLQLSSYAGTLQMYRDEKIQQTSQVTLLREPLQLISNNIGIPTTTNTGFKMAFAGMQRLTDGRWRYTGDQASLLCSFTGKPLSPSHYSKILIKYKISNWYDLNESGAIYWATTASAAMSENQKLDFVIEADGNPHQLAIPLEESIVWSASHPVTVLRLDLGLRKDNILSIDELAIR